MVQVEAYLWHVFLGHLESDSFLHAQQSVDWLRRGLAGTAELRGSMVERSLHHDRSLAGQ